MESSILYIACMFLGGAGAWLVVRWGSGFGLPDKANHRSSHKGVVSKGGGIGILAAFFVGIIAFSKDDSLCEWDGFLRNGPVKFPKGALFNWLKMNRAVGLMDRLMKPHRRHLHQLLANEMGVAHWKVSVGYGALQLMVGIGALVIRGYGNLAVVI